MKRSKNRKLLVYQIGLALALVVFLGAGGFLLWIQTSLNREQRAIEDLAQWVTANAEEEHLPEESEEAGEEPSPIGTGYRALYEQNPDLAGWLLVGGTRINYPVMQTVDDPQFYIHRDFNKKYAYCGLPFLDAACDTENGRVLMIYGHHMKNGTMFADLMKYKDAAYGAEHMEVWFDNLKDSGKYRVFAAFYADIDAPESRFHYERLPDESDEEAVESYIQGLKKASRYDTGVTPEAGAKVIVLSTCSYHAKNGRFVVAAVRE